MKYTLAQFLISFVRVLQAWLPVPLVVQERVEGLRVGEHHVAVRIGHAFSVRASVDAGSDVRSAQHVLKIKFLGGAALSEQSGLYWVRPLCFPGHCG